MTVGLFTSSTLGLEYGLGTSEEVFNLSFFLKLPPGTDLFQPNSSQESGGRVCGTRSGLLVQQSLAGFS